MAFACTRESVIWNPTHRRARSSALAVGVLLLVLGPWRDTRAGEKQFGYVYEPLTLPPGQVELEQWVTPRLGKAGGVFSEIDLSTEIEVGVVDNLQTSLYLNTIATRAVDARASHRSRGFVTDDAGNQKFSSFEFDNVANEWLFKVFDPVADPIGLALYVEPETNGQEFEIEEKIIVGKTWGGLSLDANLIFEQDWRDGSTGEPNRELHFNLTAGVAYRFPKTPFGIGLEFRDENTLAYYTKYTHSVISLGPNLHFVRDHFWATLTVLPQLVSPTPTYKSFDYDRYEVVEVRLIVGIEF
jgi:hypothetical protein